MHANPKQCQEKMKSLKKKYKAADRLQWRSIGIESEDDLEDHEVFVSFKWFDNLHAVMQTRAVVNPPVLLDTSEVEMSSLSSPRVEEQVQPEGEQQGEDEELCDAATQPLLDSNRPGPSNREEPASGLSKKTDAEPKKKKRKTTKVENTMQRLYEKFSAQQEKALKEAREMEARRIELEERPASPPIQFKGRTETQYLILLREMCSTRHNIAVPPAVPPTPSSSPMYAFPPLDEEDQQ